MKKMSKRTLALVLAIAVFTVSALVLRASLTGGFSVQVKNVNIVTDEGVNLSATLWVPKNATTDTPAAVSTMPLKLATRRRAIMAGKMIRLEISIVPIMRMPSTTVMAVRKEITN